MHVVVIAATRNPGSHTAEAASALLEGIRAGGGSGEWVFLPRLRIERCRHCEHDGPGACRTEGRCIVNDDFESVVDKIRRADAVVFATPVYIGGSGQSLRALLHRLCNVCTHPAGRKDVAGTPALGLCVGGGASHCGIRLKGILTACGFEVVDVVGALRGELHLKRRSLAAAGRRLAAARPASRSA